MLRRSLAPVLVLSVCVLWSAACSDDKTTPAVTAPDRPLTTVTVTSNSTDFDLEAFEVPVGEEVALTYVNDDDGVPHNLAIRGVEGASTELEEGPDTQTVRFTVDEAGSYTYVCDVHAQLMKGTMTAVTPDR